MIVSLLNTSIVCLKTGKYRIFKEKAFAYVDVENTNEYLMINIGSYKYYFNKNGTFDSMFRGQNRCNHCSQMFYEILELAVEQFNTWSWHKIN